MKRLTTLMLVPLIFVFFVACSSENGNGTESSEQIVVTTTIAQIADIVKNVGGDHVIVHSLMGPGTDPHLYNATQGDISKLLEANIIFYNGLHLEGKMNETIKNMERDKPTYAVAETVPKEVLLLDGEDEAQFDPHIWFDPNLWKYAVETVRDGLIEIDPANEQDYKNNTDVYLALLNELDKYAKEQITTIPEESRVLITAHDAFAYFGSAYGFEVLGLQGISTDAEYGLRDVQGLVDIIVKRNIKAVFLESSIADRSINAVVEGAKQRGQNVMIGGELFSDAMGQEGTFEGTYEGMTKHNIDIIVSSLK